MFKHREFIDFPIFTRISPRDRERDLVPLPVVQCPHIDLMDRMDFIDIKGREVGRDLPPSPPPLLLLSASLPALLPSLPRPQ